MAAGLGFKTFTTGEVLTAADTNGYLMQGILVFASATARDAAITAPEEGQFAYLKDTNVTTYYTGSAWANVDTTGMTNPMTTTADMIYSSSGSTPARLGIGTAGQVLTVNSGATAPEWAAAAAGGKVLQVVQNTFATITTITSPTYTDSGLSASITPTSASSKVLVLVMQIHRMDRTSGTMVSALKLFRDATAILDDSEFKVTNTLENDALPIIFLDTPATTSAITYKTQYGFAAGVGSIVCQPGSNTSTMVLLEIGA